MVWAWTVAWVGRPGWPWRFPSSRPSFRGLGQAFQVLVVSAKSLRSRSSRSSLSGLAHLDQVSQVSLVSAKSLRSRSSRPSLSGLARLDQVSQVSVVSTKSLRSRSGRPSLGQPGGSRLERLRVDLAHTDRVTYSKNKKFGNDNVMILCKRV